MSKRIVIRGGFRDGHWKEAFHALRGGGIVLVPAMVEDEKGRLRADNLALVSPNEEKLKPYGYEGRQRLLPNRVVLNSLGVDLKPEASRLLGTFPHGSISLRLETRDPAPAPQTPGCRPAASVVVMFPYVEFAAKVLARIDRPVYYQEILDTDSADDVKTEYGDAVEVWLDTGIATFRPSTLLDLSRPTPILLRKGVVPLLDAEAAIGRRIKLGPDVYFTVLFICTGNTCRSAMAKGILEQRLKGERVMVYSAGTHDFGRMPASDGALEVAREYGADLSSHYSVPLSRYLIDTADLILCMEHRHKSRVLELSPEAASRTFMLTVYANCPGIDEIFDPVGSSVPIFRKVAEQINQCLDVVVRDVKERTGREEQAG